MAPKKKIKSASISKKKLIGSAGNNSHSNDKIFPLAVVGASAGGLEAFTELLKGIPKDIDMALVFVQHLAPTFKSYLTEILSRSASLPVISIDNGMKPEPRNIYVLQPGHDLLMKNGKFKLIKRPKNSKVHLPIDIFMRSAAADKTHYSIGVILSGADSDGVLGLREIKSEGGITFAQERSTAKFSEMPGHAIKAGVIDFVLPPAAIARELSRISRHSYLAYARKNTVDEILPDEVADVNKIFMMLRGSQNVDFSNYKPNTVKRRILRRMVMHKIEKLHEYVRLLQNNKEELRELYYDMLINVTSFFRDPLMYETLKKKVFPDIIKNRNRNGPVRIWVSACSTGEEAYSLAIIITEFLGKRIFDIPVQIFATDLSEPGIEKARTGIFPEDIKSDVSNERLRKFFINVDGKYQLKKAIRDMCIFARQNLIQDPPFSKIDIISCRNVLIYLGSPLQKKVISTFHYALKPGGFMILGSSESVGGFSDLFKMYDKKNKIYRKKNANVNIPFETVPVNNNYDSDYNIIKNSVSRLTESQELQKDTDSALLNRFTPASILINKDMKIVQFRGNINKFLKLPEGTANYNLFQMLKNGLSVDLRSLVSQLIKKKEIVNKEISSFINEKGEPEFLNIIGIPLRSGTRDELYFLIAFEYGHPLENKKNKRNGKSHLKRAAGSAPGLRKELLSTKEYLQVIIEQQEITNEELRSANEEIQSSNEELQSSNEELETAKEELQSTNEELTTVNEELINKNSELAGVNNDLNNLLNSINIPIVILDNELKIRRYTSMAEHLLNIIPTDIGRKITDLNPNIKIPDLKAIINEVVDTPVVKELQVKDKAGIWYSMIIKPYKTVDQKINGVVIVFININALKKSLHELENSKKQIEDFSKKLELEVNAKTVELRKSNIILEEEVSERKNIEQSLRVLSRHLVSGQEKERLRISRDLHDGVNQNLIAVKLLVHAAEKGFNKSADTKTKKNLKEGKILLNRTMEEVRRISKNLRPSSLDEIGLKQSIETLFKEHKSRIRTRIRIGNLSKNIPKDIELSVYRIIQEAFNNIIRHAKATFINLELSEKNGVLKLFIKDNGKGFNIKKARSFDRRRPKFGLLGMRERAESAGGIFEVKSLPRLGTEISVTIPYKKTK